MALLTPPQIRELCDSLGVSPTKKLGQNFVIDPGTVRRIVRAAGVEASEHILEYGPGLGSLSLAILETGAALTAVEIDPRLAAALPGTVAAQTDGGLERLRVINSDALVLQGSADLRVAGIHCGTDPRLQEEPQALVANLPYNVAVPLILQALQRFPNIQRALVMVQEEVADRLVAGPGSKTYGVPSVKLGWNARAVKVGRIGTEVFYPAPNVTSALVEITRQEPCGDEANRELAFSLIEAAFGQRRKTLRQALANVIGTPGAAEEVLREAGIDPGARGESLTVEDFKNLAAAWKQD